MKPIDVNSSTYIDFGVENIDKDTKFKVGDHVKILIKIFLQDASIKIGLKKFFGLKKLEIQLY